MKKHVASGLVDALLAGAPDVRSARARCAKTLGRNHRWLGRLVAGLIEQFGSAWHAASRERLIAAVIEHPSFDTAWTSGSPPRIRNYSLASPAMTPLPFALAGCTVPNLPTPGDIARWLGLTSRQLDWFAGRAHWREDADSRAPRHYVYRWLPKRRGGFRLIESPKQHLRQLQRLILHELLDYLPIHQAAHGFRVAHSPLTNASSHLGRRVVIGMDLQDFFPSVGGTKVNALFRALGYPDRSARMLTALCTNAVPADQLSISGVAKYASYDFEQPQLDRRARQRFARPHLPQGAPCSPALANLCAFRLDLRLHYAAEAVGARYTRYADDLTFSGDSQLNRAVDRFVPLVAAIATAEGFAINFRKTRIMRRGARQRVTGIVVNEIPNVPRRDYDLLKATLNNCVRLGPSSQNRGGHHDFRSHLAGRIAHVRHINPARAQRLQQLFERIRW